MCIKLYMISTVVATCFCSKEGGICHPTGPALQKYNSEPHFSGKINRLWKFFVLASMAPMKSPNVFFLKSLVTGDVLLTPLFFLSGLRYRR